MAVPDVSVVNFTPTSVEAVSPESAVVGWVLVPQIEQGHVTLTVVPDDGFSRFPLSSTARVSMVVVGFPWAIHE